MVFTYFFNRKTISIHSPRVGRDTAEQLTRLDNILKCRMMKEIIKGNVKYVEFNQLDMDDVMIGQEWD